MFLNVKMKLLFFNVMYNFLFNEVNDLDIYCEFVLRIFFCCEILNFGILCLICFKNKLMLIFVGLLMYYKYCVYICFLLRVF